MQYLSHRSNIIKNQFFADLETIIPSNGFHKNISTYLYAASRLATITFLAWTALMSPFALCLGQVGTAFNFGVVTVLTHDVLQMMINGEKREGGVRGDIMASAGKTSRIGSKLLGLEIEIKDRHNIAAISYGNDIAHNTILPIVWMPFLALTRAAYIQYKTK